MTLSAEFLITFLLVFVRASAMLLASPLFGGNVPAMLRAMTAAAIALATTPVAAGRTPIPQDLYSLTIAVMHAALSGILIGLALHLVVYGAQMAGAFLDLSLGIGASQVLNPLTGGQVSILAQFKYMLVVVLLLSLNAHHLMIEAFAASLRMPGPAMEGLSGMMESVVSLVGHATLIAVHMAAPVAAVTLVIDVAAGVIGKSVPQMQVFFLTIPAKVLLGLLALSLGLPAMLSVASSAVERAFEIVGRMLGG